MAPTERTVHTLAAQMGRKLSSLKVFMADFPPSALLPKLAQIALLHLIYF